MDLESLNSKSHHFLEWEPHHWHGKFIVQVAADHVQHLVYIGNPICYDAGTEVCCIQVWCCSPTIYHTSFNAWVYDGSCSVHSCVLLFLCMFQFMILKSIVLYWATCRYDNIHGCGKMEQKVSQTWKSSSRSSSIHVTSVHEIATWAKIIN